MVNLDKINQADLWYVIGYIVTDGYLSIDGRHINITSKDRGHLYKIRNTLQLQNKIGRKARSTEKIKRYSQLEFGDVNFYKYLNKIGITTRKSLTLGSLKINGEYFSDFFRGVVDGDGNISTWIHRTNRINQWCLRIYSASFSFIEWLNKKIENYFGVKGRLYFKKAVNKNNPIYLLKFGKISACKILKQIYYKDCLSLERKYLLAQQCLQEMGKNGKLNPWAQVLE